MRRRDRGFALAVAVALTAATLAPVIATPAGAASGPVIRVPTDVPTIQRAVDRATPGTLVLVAPGVHHETVTVRRPNIVIRGESRSGTVVDCGFNTDGDKANAFTVKADGIAIENLSARDCIGNGFLWDGVKGYRGSYLTAIRNGDYGVYAFNSTFGQFDHDYAAGSPDAGFYIGQCYPCHAVITDVESEWNGLGYSGTNAGGSLVIARSSFHDNRAGIVPNSGTEEAKPPQRNLTIVGNRVSRNNNPATAAIDIAATATGNGILVAGGVDDLVERNRVDRQDLAGIGVIPLPEKIVSPGPNARNFDALGNVVRANVVTGSTYDLFLVSTIDSAVSSGRNCFTANRFATSLPAKLEQVAPCRGRPAAKFQTDLAAFARAFAGTKPPPEDFKTVALPDPPPLPDLPHARTAPAHPARDEPEVRIDPARVTVPPPIPPSR